VKVIAQQEVVFRNRRENMIRVLTILGRDIYVIKMLMAILLCVVFIKYTACKCHSFIELSQNIEDICRGYTVVGAAIDEAITQLISCCPLPLNIIRQSLEEFENTFVSSSLLFIPFLATFCGVTALLLVAPLAHFAVSCVTDANPADSKYGLFNKKEKQSVLLYTRK
jgi:hypothetical protein